MVIKVLKNYVNERKLGSDTDKDRKGGFMAAHDLPTAMELTVEGGYWEIVSLEREMQSRPGINVTSCRKYPKPSGEGDV